MVKKDIQRYLIANDGPNPENLKSAFAHALHICNINNLAKVTLLFFQKDKFKNSEVAKFLGHQCSQELCKGNSVKISDSKSMHLLFERNFDSLDNYDVVLGLYITPKGIDKIDGLFSAKVIILLPWINTEAVNWVQTWSPIIIGDRSIFASPNKMEPRVEDALTRLTNCINLSSGLGHPSDERTAKAIFGELKREGVHFVPQEIRNWAVRNNWDPIYANTLSRLSKRYS